MGVAAVITDDALLVAMVVGALAGLVLLARHRDRRRVFPFGPCLGLGTIVALLLS